MDSESGSTDRAAKQSQRAFHILMSLCMLFAIMYTNGPRRLMCSHFPDSAMFRRIANTATAKPTVAARSYWNPQHHEYPHLWIVTSGVPAIIAVSLLGFMSWGSVWWESNRTWKRQINKSWARRLGKGYDWADKLPQETITNIYKNLPSSAV